MALKVIQMITLRNIDIKQNYHNNKFNYFTENSNEWYKQAIGNFINEMSSYDTDLKNIMTDFAINLNITYLNIIVICHKNMFVIL